MKALMSFLSLIAVSLTLVTAQAKEREVIFEAVCDQLLEGNTKHGFAQYTITYLPKATFVVYDNAQASYQVGGYRNHVKTEPDEGYRTALLYENFMAKVKTFASDEIVLKSHTNQGGWGEPSTNYETTLDLKTMQLTQRTIVKDQILTLIPFLAIHYKAQCQRIR